MWLLVLFDLPTTEDATRKAANRFRRDLRSLGFERMQLSAYTRRCPGLTTTMMSKVRMVAPPYGSVCVLELTDLQYEGIVRLDAGRTVVFEKPKRLVSF